MEHYEDPEVAACIAQIKSMQPEHASSKSKEADVDSVCRTIFAWMDRNAKITPLKQLQGWIWRQGYEDGSLRGHLYHDAYACIKAWTQQQRLPVYIYSSGSVQAQRLLFGHSEFGDVTPMISGHFDTTIGDKKQADSYRKIGRQIEADLSGPVKPEHILFLSDNPLELSASRCAGMQVVQTIREGVVPDARFAQIDSFHKLTISAVPLSKL